MQVPEQRGRQTPLVEPASDRTMHAFCLTRRMSSSLCTVFCHRLPAVSSHRGPSRRRHVKGFRPCLRTDGMATEKFSESKHRGMQVIRCALLCDSAVRATCRRAPQRLRVTVPERRAGHRRGCKRKIRGNYVTGTGLNQRQHQLDWQTQLPANWSSGDILRLCLCPHLLEIDLQRHLLAYQPFDRHRLEHLLAVLDQEHPRGCLNS